MSDPTPKRPAGTPRTMVVDDETDITQVLKMALARSGFAPDSFNDPLTALEQLQPSYYDMILPDIKMPVMNGFELYRELQKKDPRVKPCFMSAFDISSQELAKFMPPNERPFIRKPFVLPDLVKKLSEVPQTS